MAQTKEQQLKSRLQSEQGHYNFASGHYGFRMVTSTFSPTANEFFNALVVIVAADISATNSLGGDTLTGAITFPAGTVVYGLFAASTVSVTTGAVKAYRAE